MFEISLEQRINCIRRAPRVHSFMPWIIAVNETMLLCLTERRYDFRQNCVVRMPVSTIVEQVLVSECRLLLLLSCVTADAVQSLNW